MSLPHVLPGDAALKKELLQFMAEHPSVARFAVRHDHATRSLPHILQWWSFSGDSAKSQQDAVTHYVYNPAAGCVMFQQHLSCCLDAPVSHSRCPRGALQRKSRLGTDNNPGPLPCVCVCILHFPQIPDDIVFVEEIPHNATGKVSKLTLRQMFKDYKPALAKL